MQILPGPVLGRYGVYGNLFIRQQRDKMFPRGTPGREYGGGFTAKMGNGARHVNAAAARLKQRGATA